MQVKEEIKEEPLSDEEKAAACWRCQCRVYIGLWVLGLELGLVLGRPAGYFVSSLVCLREPYSGTFVQRVVGAILFEQSKLSYLPFLHG